MFNKFRATLLRYHEMSLPMLTQLKSWMKGAQSLNIVNVDYNAPSLRVAVAVTPTGEGVSYTVIEKMMLCSAFAINPKASVSEAQLAGDAIDKEMEAQAQLEGIGKVFLMVPEGNPLQEDANTTEIRNVRVFIRRIPQTVFTGNAHNLPLATKYIN